MLNHFPFRLLLHKYSIMIHRAEGYLGVSDYAKMCSVSPRNIRDRIRAGSIRFMKLDGFCFVNAMLSPPVKRINPSKPARPSGAPPSHFPFEGLREVRSFARGKRFPEGVFFEAILTGRLDGYIIGDKVFVKPEEAEHFYRNRRSRRR